MKNLTSVLDKVATELESKGLSSLSKDIDVVSNTLEKTAIFGFGKGQTGEQGKERLDELEIQSLYRVHDFVRLLDRVFKDLFEKNTPITRDLLGGVDIEELAKNLERLGNGLKAGHTH